jgi:hypothetical protein
VVRRGVNNRITEYKEDKRRRISQEAQTALVQTTPGMPNLPYMLERVWHRLEWQTQLYLIARACDWVTYGDVVADRTFPQPTLPGIPPEEVCAAVAALMQLLLEAQAQHKASWERGWKRVEEQFLREVLWRYDGLIRLHVYQAEGRVHMRESGGWSLPPRIFTAEERTTLLEACRTELAQANGGGNGIFAALEDFVQFCQLLRQPENHVRGTIAQYVEREVNTYSTAEMRAQMEEELIDLPFFTAYAKVIQERGGEQFVLKRKIKTLPLSDLPDVDGGRLEDIKRRSRVNAVRAGILVERKTIEQEIRKRQERWRSVLPAEPLQLEPPEEPPPPIDF